MITDYIAVSSISSLINSIVSSGVANNMISVMIIQAVTATDFFKSMTIKSLNIAMVLKLLAVSFSK